ncbi:YchF family ATPase, partial [Patescibacteria group bacterium]|nr:YchF family ATPase [Patescibacteria group bacterium]
IANYPFATIDPNIGTVPVPDDRLEKLAKLSESKQIVPAVVEFYDIAGLVKGANQGEGLGNKFLSHIREVKVIVHVVRVFESEEIIHVDDSVNPIRDIETINTELMLKDMETLERRLNTAEKEAKTGDKKKIKDFETLGLAKKALDEGSLVLSLGENILSQPVITELGLLTAKPQILLFNGKESDVKEDLIKTAEEFGFYYIVVDLSQDVLLDDLIRMSYKTLDLISFLTTGPEETRGWTVRRGSDAPTAAGVIHTDFHDKFIRMEAILWDKLLEANGWNEARAKGLIRTEGKNYIVQDGDVVLIRHS